MNFKTGEKFNDTEIGGLSGVVYDQKNNLLLAISDDRSIINPARFYEFKLLLNNKSFQLTPFKVVTLKDEKNINFKKHEVDFEGITIMGENIIISSEGGINREKPIPPSLVVFNREGQFIKNLDVDKKFLPPFHSLDKKYGVRDNLAFEGLSAYSNNLVIGIEEALFQDDTISTPFHDSKIRLLFYKDFLPTKEVLYQLDQVAKIPVAGLSVGETGLSEITFIDEKSAFVLERSYLPLAKKSIIKIYKISNIDSATNIKSFETIKDKKIEPIHKELILNLDNVIDKLNENYKTLDNIEGICFGPTLQNGHKTLILVSDNNFSKNQRTQFLAFEIIP